MVLFVNVWRGEARVQLAFTENDSLYCDLHKDLFGNRFFGEVFKKKEKLPINLKVSM